MALTNQAVKILPGLLLVLSTLPLTTTSNIDCHGKAFHCVNLTHFMICVDIGHGFSSTIDDFTIPCPANTECRITNRFECDYPPPPTTTLYQFTEETTPSQPTETLIEWKSNNVVLQTTVNPLMQTHSIIGEVIIPEKDVTIETIIPKGSSKNEIATEKEMIENVDHNSSSQMNELYTSGVDLSIVSVSGNSLDRLTMDLTTTIAPVSEILSTTEAITKSDKTTAFDDLGTYSAYDTTSVKSLIELTTGGKAFIDISTNSLLSVSPDVTNNVVYELKNNTAFTEPYETSTATIRDDFEVVSANSNTEIITLNNDYIFTTTERVTINTDETNFGIQDFSNIPDIIIPTSNSITVDVTESPTITNDMNGVFTTEGLINPDPVHISSTISAIKTTELSTYTTEPLNTGKHAFSNTDTTQDLGVTTLEDFKENTGLESMSHDLLNKPTLPSAPNFNEATTNTIDTDYTEPINNNIYDLTTNIYSTEQPFLITALGKLDNEKTQHTVFPTVNLATETSAITTDPNINLITQVHSTAYESVITSSPYFEHSTEYFYPASKTTKESSATNAYEYITESSNNLLSTRSETNIDREGIKYIDIGYDITTPSIVDNLSTVTKTATDDFDQVEFYVAPDNRTSSRNSENLTLVQTEYDPHKLKEHIVVMIDNQTEDSVLGEQNINTVNTFVKPGIDNELLSVPTTEIINSSNIRESTSYKKFQEEEKFKTTTEIYTSEINYTVETKHEDTTFKSSSNSDILTTTSTLKSVSALESSYVINEASASTNIFISDGFETNLATAKAKIEEVTESYRPLSTTSTQYINSMINNELDAKINKNDTISTTVAIIEANAATDYIIVEDTTIVDQTLIRSVSTASSDLYNVIFPINPTTATKENSNAGTESSNYVKQTISNVDERVDIRARPYAHTTKVSSSLDLVSEQNMKVKDLNTTTIIDPKEITMSEQLTPTHAPLIQTENKACNDSDLEHIQGKNISVTELVESQSLKNLKTNFTANVTNTNIGISNTINLDSNIENIFVTTTTAALPTDSLQKRDFQFNTEDFIMMTAPNVESTNSLGRQNFTTVTDIVADMNIHKQTYNANTYIQSNSKSIGDILGIKKQKETVSYIGPVTGTTIDNNNGVAVNISKSAPNTENTTAKETINFNVNKKIVENSVSNLLNTTAEAMTDPTSAIAKNNVNLLNNKQITTHKINTSESVNQNISLRFWANETEKSVKYDRLSSQTTVNPVNKNQSIEHPSNVQIIKANTSTLHNDIQNTKANFDCLYRYRGRYADAENCRKFYICVGRQNPIIGICPPNTVFSDIRKQCTRNLSHCVRNYVFYCTSEGRFSDLFEDNIYYLCLKTTENRFIRYKLQCERGYYLDKISIQCNSNTATTIRSTLSDSNNSQKSSDTSSGSKTNSNESEKITSTNGDFTCEKEGKFADPKNSRKYYVCSKNNKLIFRRKLKSCDSDEVFDLQKLKCVDAESSEVICNVGT